MVFSPLDLFVADKTWKARERSVAAMFGTERTPLSGGNGKQTRSDTLHPRLFIEHKHRKKHSVIGLYDETKAMAQTEGKTPVVTLSQHNRPGVLIICAPEHITAIAEELRSEEASNNG